MNHDLAILIVDDEPDLVKSVRRILRLDGYRVDTATSIAEMLDRDNWPDYFAVLLDRRLPDGMADAAILKIKELAPDAAVIMVTAFADLEGTLAALHHGAEDYFLKPVEPEHLRARLKRLADLRRAEAELDHQREFARILLDTTRALVLVLDADGRVLRVNRHLEQLAGYREVELAGRPVVEILIPDHYGEEAQRHLAASYDETYDQGTSHPLLTKTGTECEVAWWNAPLKNERGETVELVCAGIDQTEVNRLQRQLVQSERLAAIGEAMAGLAHESRNALQRSQVCLDLLGDELQDRPESLDLLASIQRAQDDLHLLYEKVRAYSAPLQLQPRYQHIGNIVRRAWEDLATVRNGREARLEEHAQCDDLHCEVDAFTLGQVFRNILENALQVCSDPVEIQVNYAEAKADRPSLSIAIRDNGPGLPQEHSQRVFDSFFTTKTEGTGLGMAIAQRIVEAHSGQIAVSSDCERGAEFVLTLPREQT